MISSISGMTGGQPPQVVSGASMRQPSAQRMASLFDKIDSSGSGSITKAQFEQAFQNLKPPKGLQAQGADAIFSQLDSSGSGSVSKQDFVTGMTKVLAQMHAQHAGHRADGDADDTAAGSVDNKATGANEISDLVNALKSLESTLGGRSTSNQDPVTGTLFNAKA